MASKSLYLKYRPQNFENLIGQDFVKNTLINAIKFNLVAHAYLFTGPRGTGKTSSARLIAKALNCQNLKNNHDPCNNCEFCKAITEGNFIDLIEIDAASNRGIDEIRDLKEKIRFSPTRSKFKIYIIDEVHMLTKEAFNALLKTLEEPPEHSYFILATTEIHKIPETIISRCQRFDFRRVPINVMSDHLGQIAKSENIEISNEALKMIAKYSEGCVRDAVGLLDQLNLGEKITEDYVSSSLGLTGFSVLENLFNLIIEDNSDTKNIKESLEIVNNLYLKGTDFKQFIEEFLEFLREKTLALFSEKSSKSTTPLQISKILEIINNFQKAKSNYDPAIPQLSVEIALIETNLDQFEKLTSFQKSEKVTVPEKKLDEKPQNSIHSKKTSKTKKVFKEVKDDSNVKTPSKHLDFKEIKKIWSELVKKIKTPTLRMSFKTGHPTQLENQSLQITFNSNFHFSKVNSAENLKELEDLLFEEFNFDLKINPLVDASFQTHQDLKVEKLNSGDRLTKQEKSQNLKKDVDDVLDIFGGEIVN